MKSLPAFLLISCLGTIGCVHHQSRIPNWKPQPPVNGVYGPDPRESWFAGELIRIKGTNFHYVAFTDVLVPGEPPPDFRGVVKVLNDRILLEGPDRTDYRISGLLAGQRVLWTSFGYDKWRRTGEVDTDQILYKSKKWQKEVAE
jgi:hypothetical protein